ncbi:hypothetical protein AARI_17590 [Glutamicibacter arilaitensis Re117]|uniref:NusG-like N-terminal domain-containing protein n=1 Tax=Glutamicibacter arilaitensis (strain DSM 16368 / CIP 108037 / IAM 15318 / JCM 13566 / NCIMB 14258 / Re117) TaxID=861360 RepID=A0ABM9PXF4_GLUAR|nr:hypothetical protein AARI_17590 [Glutamicibacter arilaitensis Re117]
MIEAPWYLLRTPGDHIQNVTQDALGAAGMLSLDGIHEVQIPWAGQEALPG